jgi:hypothetical protein
MKVKTQKRFKKKSSKLGVAEMIPNQTLKYVGVETVYVSNSFGGK